MDSSSGACRLHRLSVGLEGGGGVEGRANKPGQGLEDGEPGPGLEDPVRGGDVIGGVVWR